GTAGGLVGIYPQARIYSWNATSTGPLESHNVLRGMDVASRYCPGVILLSLGFSGDYFFYAKYLLQEGIDLAVQRGCLVVAAAGVWTLRPELKASQVAEVLRRSARALGPARPNNDTGWGLLDVAAALLAPAPPPDPLEPNDDIWYDQPLGLPNAGSQPITSP